MNHLIPLRLAYVSLLAAGSVCHGRPVAAPVLPTVPPEFKVELFAREPLVRNPCAMAFDARGRLFVGQGPQYRSPTPYTPGDSIVILIDSDGDGIADSAKTFADGLNCIQGLAWHGRDLWVGNSPDLTIVRDLDGDDVADVYIKVYTDLGNLEHANHGHTWAPDGKLYFSQGNSKGLTQPGRVAPKPFRDLWDVKAPAGTPDFPPPQVFSRADYKATYQDPSDDWGREGGVLRCDGMGTNLEIVSRGMRNPWDIAFDSGFNWLGTDNDQSDGDRLFMPFFGAHFGWSHGWSNHWTGEDHLPTVPVSGPVFDGSGTGIAFYDWEQMPATHRGVWFFNDWLRKTTFMFRPVWDGALVQPKGGRWEPFIRGRGALYKPTDIVVGPEGTLYVSGWGEELGAVWRNGEQANEGRIFRISWPEASAGNWNTPKRGRPISQWTFAELAEDLGAPLPVWSIDAQDELVRRGAREKAALMALLADTSLPEARQTWAIWALGRMAPNDSDIDEWLANTGRKLSHNARIQSIRIAAHRIREHRTADRLPEFVVAALEDSDPRVRFAAVQAIAQARQQPLMAELCELAARETDRVTFYAAWQALREIATPDALRALLRDSRGGVRRAVLLALLESRELPSFAVQGFVQDPDPATAEIAATWLAKSNGNPLIDMHPKPGDFIDSVTVGFTPGVKPATVHFTLDGSEPTQSSPTGQTGRIDRTTSLKAALFINGQKVGNTLVATYRKRESNLKLPELGTVEQATEASQVLPLLESADLTRGRDLFNAAGCAACHRAGDEGRSIGPDLSAIGERDDAGAVIRSILDPNQIIVEGYSLLTVSTQDGSEFAGIFEAETDHTLSLTQFDGELVAIDRHRITNRQSVHHSAMPSYARVLDPDQLADLVGWLLSLGAIPATATSADGSETQASDADGLAKTGFGWTLEAERLSITYAGAPVADYVFSHPEILRPHFQNLRAPSGAQVTRNHPPLVDEPADHATMHPGVWLAFGDINGQDFWRNKGRIEHMGFIEQPSAKGNALTFATANRLLASDATTLGTQTSWFEIERVGENAFRLIWSAELHGEGRELVFGEQEEMGFGVRLATTLTEKNGGLVVNSDGLEGARTAWGKPAAWASYSREIDGRIRGAAIFAAESNPNPTWWHTRDYGLMVANGFGKRVLPDGTDGKLVVKPGEALRLRYAVLLFDTPAAAPVDFLSANRKFQKTGSLRQ